MLIGQALGADEVSAALAEITVGVVVERRKAKSLWVDFLWRPVSVLAGAPAAAPWTVLASCGEVTTYYAGLAKIALHRGETANYRDNLASGAPGLWVVLRPSEGEPPYTVFAVTADPAEGEAFAGAGNDIVEQVPMPQPVVEMVEAFIAAHHVERPFFKRTRKDNDE